MSPLKDYTTKKQPEETISEISSLLRGYGIQGVLSEYDSTGNVVCMSFRMIINNNPMVFRLPTDWRPILKVFQKDRKTPRAACTEEQARRTAWRLIYHWIDAQLALVKVGMVKIQTIFLPYAVQSNNKTLSENFNDSPELFLQAPK